MRREKVFWAILVLFSLVIFLAAAEILLRIFYKNELKFRDAELNLTYRYDPTYGWFPVPGSEKEFTATRKILVRHNSRGFRDVETGPKTKPRILFLGDSFVWGYDVEAGERFTEKLQLVLTDWEVVNLGVSGYGTDQEYLLLRDQFDFYRPDIVLLVICTDNDLEDNRRNMIMGGYYKPYFVVEKETLVVKGVPVEKQREYYYAQYPGLFRSYLFRAAAKVYFMAIRQKGVTVPDPSKDIVRAIRTFVESRGAKFAVGLQENHEQLSDFLSQEGIPYVSLANPYKYRSHGFHWTPEGHTFVSRKIYDFLVSEGMLSSAGRPRKGNSETGRR